ncbi:hypothetical protein M2451_002951 [Dysgonomonas sp. PFB1-18]|uniref:DUF3945 domain-containing protein n=1 Tax=unclassified Dysgonomonas TaxID=2630389 RepID=UPI0013D535BA|nr:MULTISPECIES: DUF3945 domain-containing protein [unclassified Dysgonomonas]MDH6310061.1 hypothetical protein [Dysgonomonas sp. PF1-14]MDH6339970.1 hypothetical protein [Dysgonomonas sp. PF1-16]MDH6381618.1 hypothetical protein [Dysgonomonas sp. PFB1-18]MDH6398745.1 hypothetical protein [Dysgonomonas sp. PF1-23]NDV93591.1 DUF3945 domain-containing protein [Dysgonomonas sp. 521]
MNENLKDQDVLLVSEKDSNKLNVVTGMNEDGTPKTAKPDQKNEPDFLKIDKQGDALENFMSNFLRQCKEPTHFHFFKVPLAAIESTVLALQEMLKNPDNPSNKEMLDQHRVLPEAFAKKPYQAIDESRIDWSQFEKLGVTKDIIDKNSLDKMLNWQKTPMLLPIKAEIGDTTIRTDARLSLRETPEGKLNLVVHAVRKEPQLDGYVYGTRLTEDDKQNLRQTGNAGRLIEIEPVKGEKMKAFVSIDKMTNELVAVRADKIKIPNEIKGVTLNEQQKKDLTEGKAVYLDGMTSKNGKDFNALVQINADRRGLEFRFDNANKLEKSQQQPQQQKNDASQFRIPSKLLGVELAKDQQEKLKEGQTIYVSGMKDKAGESFNAYIKVNAEKGKLDFFKWNPDKAKQVTPDNASKTQVAVNSEGKTNEATKKNEEPLQKGQTQPSEKQQEKQEKKEVAQKPKGIRR